MQVDADLHSFRCDVSTLLLAEAGQPGLADDGVLSRLTLQLNKAVHASQLCSYMQCLHTLCC